MWAFRWFQENKMARTDTDGSDTDTKLNTVMPETPTTAATNSVKHAQASDKKRGEAATTANNNSEAIARTQTTIRKVTFALPPEAEPMSVLAKVTKRRNSLRQCRPQTQKFQDFQESRKKQKRETPKSQSPTQASPTLPSPTLPRPRLRCPRLPRPRLPSPNPPSPQL